MPHGHCYLWQKHILFTHVISDVLIALAYFSIPIGIMLFINGRKDIKDRSIFILFSLFIVSCGITHVFGVWTIWEGIYGVHGLAKAVTAFVSVVTAIHVFRLLPKAINFPSPEQYEGVMSQLSIQSSENAELVKELESQKLAMVMLNALPTSTLLVDENGAIMLANDTTQSEYGFSADTLIGRSLNDFFIATDIRFNELLTDYIRTGIRKGKKMSFNGQIRSSDSSKIPVELKLSAIHFEDQKLLLVTINNLTELSELKTNLIKSHQQYERSINATEDGIWEWDIRNNNSLLSPTFYDLLGIDPADQAGYDDSEHVDFDRWFDHIHPDYQPVVQQAIDHHFASKEKYFVEYLGKDKHGNYGWFQAKGDSTFDSDGKPQIMSGSLRNIDDQKAVEVELDQQKDFLENMINNAVCGLYLYDIQEHRNIKINQRYTEILGYDLEALEAIDDFSQLFHREDRDRVFKHIYEVINGDEGDRVPLEYRFRHQDGHWVWCYSYDAVIKRDDDGNPVVMLGTFIDVTERNALTEMLTESNQYLERFAFVASHDLQEPLRKITAFSDSLTESLSDKLVDESERYELSRISDAASRMRTMIQDLLSLSRINRKELNIQSVDIADLVFEVLHDLSFIIEERSANIRTNYQIPEIHADRSLFRQVLQNLIQNAIKFTPEARIPEIIIDVATDAQKYRITITDNGVGIDEQYWASIFEPFRRLHRKDEFEGSGIGLALVRQVMFVHDGTVKCISSSEQGTTFLLELPRLNDG